VIAALNVSVHASRASMTVLRRDFLPFARDTVAAIEEDLRPPVPQLLQRRRVVTPDG
jgi:hypothetical protein